jgi:hypothetical protein
MSYLLDLQPPPGLVVCDNGFTLFHLTAASFDNGKFYPSDFQHPMALLTYVVQRY